MGFLCMGVVEYGVVVYGCCVLSSDVDMVKGTVKKEKSSKIVRKVVGKSLFPQHGRCVKGKVSTWTAAGFPQTPRRKLNMELVSCL